MGALLVMFALTINLVTEESPSADLSVRGNDPDLYMVNAAIRQFDETGQLQHRIEAERFTHYPLTDLTTMQQPNMSLASGSDTSAWQINSQEGRILPGTQYREEVIELWDNVLATRDTGSGDFINVSTENLTVYPSREYAETDRRVTIDNQASRTTAAGMKAYLDSGRFMFFSNSAERVVSIFLPDQQTNLPDETSDGLLE